MLAYYTHNLSPFLWQFSEHWGIRYYGLAYFLGFLAFYGGMILFHRWGWSKLAPDKIAELMTWSILGVLVGGRLGYCLVYDLEYTLRDPLSIVAFWRGGISGMSSHGGMLGAILVMVLYARFRKTDVWQLFDHAAILTTPGIFLGRIANFINGELWGRPTHMPWGVFYPMAPDGGAIARHPSQLYEAFGEGLFLGSVLFYLRACWYRKEVERAVCTKQTGGAELGCEASVYLHGSGRVAFLFFILYGLIRIVLEYFREPDQQIGFPSRIFGIELTMGQILSAGLIVVGVLAWAIKHHLDTRPHA